MVPTHKYWRFLENLVFVVVAVMILYGLIAGFSSATWASLMGKGYVGELVEPLQTKAYYKSVLALLPMLTTF